MNSTPPAELITTSRELSGVEIQGVEISVDVARVDDGGNTFFRYWIDHPVHPETRDDLSVNVANPQTVEWAIAALLLILGQDGFAATECREDPESCFSLAVQHWAGANVLELAAASHKISQYLDPTIPDVENFDF